MTVWGWGFHRDHPKQCWQGAQLGGELFQGWDFVCLHALGNGMQAVNHGSGPPGAGGEGGGMA